MPKKLGNLALLIGGYGFGQGTLFLAQTWLVLHAQLPRFTEFGVGFYTVTLALLLVDFGSTQFLAREIAHHEDVEDANMAAWTSYWRITPVRFGVALICLVIGLTYAHYSSRFSAAYILFASPALLIWAFNATGCLDGFRLSGASGITGSLPCITSSIALIVTSDIAPGAAGAILGASLSVGYFIAVALQLSILSLTGRKNRFVLPARAAVADAAVHSGAALLTILPGQIYFRLQLAACAIFLAPAATAIFLYAKQIVTALSQLIGFIRRVEFADMVAALVRRKGSALGVIITSQRLGTLIGALSAFAMMLGGLAIHFKGRGELQAAGLAIAAFSPTILTAALALGFIQGQMALRRFQAAASVSITAVLLSAVATIVLTPVFGVVGLAIADFLGNFTTICVCMFLLTNNEDLKRSVCAS